MSKGDDVSVEMTEEVTRSGQPQRFNVENNALDCSSLALFACGCRSSRRTLQSGP